MSVTAFTGDAARKLGFVNSVDVAAQTPGLNIGTPVGEATANGVPARPYLGAAVRKQEKALKKELRRLENGK